VPGARSPRTRATARRERRRSCDEHIRSLSRPRLSVGPGEHARSEQRFCVLGPQSLHNHWLRAGACRASSGPRRSQPTVDAVGNVASTVETFVLGQARPIEGLTSGSTPSLNQRSSSLIGTSLPDIYARSANRSAEHSSRRRRAPSMACSHLPAVHAAILREAPRRQAKIGRARSASWSRTKRGPI